MRATISQSKSYRRLLSVTLLVLLVTLMQSTFAQEAPIALPPSPGTDVNGNQAQTTTSGLTGRSTGTTTTTTTTDGLLPLVTDNAAAACGTAYSKPVQLMWFYKPPTDTTASNLVPHFESYVFTRNDESSMRAIHNGGDQPVLQYIHWDSIDDPCHQAVKAKGSACSCSKKPLNNQVAWNASDVCWIRDNHPDWFLRDVAGNLLYYGNQLMMDPGNRGWQDYFLSRIKTTQPDGWDGIFMDNMATQFGMHHGDFSKILQKYPTIDSYRNAVVDYLSYIRTEYFAPQGRKMYANVSSYWGQESTYYRFLQYLDGAQDEFWAYPRSGWYRIKSFERRLVRLSETVKRGKVALLVAQGTRTDTNRQQFGLASYLLIADPNAFFRYTSDSNGGYGQMWLYDNYQSKLGQPLGNYTKSSDGVFTRNFENGKVTVNPTARTSSIKLTCQ